MSPKINIVFMGTPEFAVPSLLKLNTCHNIIRVYTQPPKPYGRGLKEKISSIHKVAIEKKIPVKFPKTFNTDDEYLELLKLKPDFIIVVAYGVILPKKIIQIPKYLSINGHASSLPRWRGAAPIQRAIEAGDKQTAVEAMIMEETLDTGAIISSKKVRISNKDTSKTLYDKLSDYMPFVLLNGIQLIINNKAKPIEQKKEGITYARKILPNEKLLNWNDEFTTIERKIRAFTPWPGIWVKHKNNLLRIHSISKIKITNDLSSFKPGQIITFSKNNCPIVLTMDNITFEIKKIQKQGGMKMSSSDFIRGYNLSIGDILN